MRQYFLSLIPQLQQRTEGRTLLRDGLLAQAFSIHSLYVVDSLQSFIVSISLGLGAGSSFRCSRSTGYPTLSPLFFLFRAG